MRKKASLTIEAAIILPMFMMGLLTLVSVLFMWLVSLRIQASLLNVAEEIAVRSANGSSISMSDAAEELAYCLSDEDYRFIENGRDGLDISGSDLDNGEYIELCVRCNLIPLTDMFGVLHVPFQRRCFAHVWCGYDNPYFADEEYVYITNDSRVYHCDRDCSHIRLTVTEISSSDIGSVRNNNGGRYRSCEICRSRPADGKLYITPEGDRYHNTVTCRGLKRSVRAIRKSEVGNRRPCSRCGR